MAGPTWRNMQSAASHPSASEKSGSEEEAERSCSCTVFFLGPVDLFEKGWVAMEKKVWYIQNS